MNAVFIVGAPRSGTSYLARAVSLSDDIAFLEESGVFSLYGARRFPWEFRRMLRNEPLYHFNPFIYEALKRTDQMRGVDRLRNLARLMILHTKLSPYDLAPSGPLVSVQNASLNDGDKQNLTEVVNKVREAEREGGKIAIRSFFSLFGEISGKGTVIEKTPDHMRMIPIIHHVFPEARFVLIRREKRDSMASYLLNFSPRKIRKNKYLPNDLLLYRQCREYNYYHRIEEWLCEKPWCFSVDYSTMIQKPYDVVRAVAEWSGMDLSKSKKQFFIGRTVRSHWGDLTVEQQRKIEKYLQ